MISSRAQRPCAAFFTLWRSANSTAGLDDVYRKYFKGSNGPVAVGEHNWRKQLGSVSTKELKQYFLDVLKAKGLTSQGGWIDASEHFLLYTEQEKICRFVLFIGGHDRIADEANPGLTKPGINGTCTLLKLSQWVAKDYKSLEHVAPQHPPEGHQMGHGYLQSWPHPQNR